MRAHELYGDFWLNSEPIVISALRGRVILVEFWDYTCVNCMRALPYVKAWHAKYEEYGLVVVGVHTPKFPFGKNPEYVQRSLERFGISFPVVMDNEGIIAARYNNREYPTVHLIDKHGFIRYQSTGDAGYHATERVLQTLLYDTGVEEDLPLLMEPLREEDRAGSICYRPTPELFAGYVKGSIGNIEGFSPESVVDYADPNVYVEDRIYAVGSWMNDRNSLRHIERDLGKLILSYHACEVTAVIKPEGDGSVEVLLTQDDDYLTEETRGDDVQFDGAGRSFVLITEPRMYHLVKNHRYGEHVLTLSTSNDGLALYSFTFVTSVIPELVSKN